jgi:ribose-phosphate pyrophosphokinase
MRNDAEIKIFSGRSNTEFTEKICTYLNVPIGKSTAITFSEGNIYVKIEEKVRGKDVYIVQTIGLDPNNEFMELLFWIDAFNRSGTNSITAIIPYFGYSKADKKDEPRVSIRARVCADCLESVGVDRIVTMDLHSPQIQGFFRKPVDHLYAANIFCEYIRSMDLDDYVIVSPDEGFAKNARYYSNKLGVALAIGNKQRLFHDECAEVIGLIGDVNNKTAIVVDDFTISCGTLVEIAKTLKNNGAKRVFAFVSHILLSQKGIDALNNSPIDKLVSTDTVNNPLVRQCNKILLLSVTDLFAKAIKIIHEKESLSELFL